MLGRYGTTRRGEGDAPGAGLPTDGEAPGLPGGALDPPGAAARAVGTRSACSGSQDTSRNGPEPMGCCENGLADSAEGGTPPRRWRGSSGWVVAVRKPATGVARVKRTVRESTAVMCTSAHDAAAAP